MYLVAFGGAWILANSRKDKFNYEWSKDQISDLVFYGSMGAVLGGRLGSVFFYNFDRFWRPSLAISCLGRWNVFPWRILGRYSCCLLLFKVD